MNPLRFFTERIWVQNMNGYLMVPSMNVYIPVTLRGCQKIPKWPFHEIKTEADTSEKILNTLIIITDMIIECMENSKNKSIMIH